MEAIREFQLAQLNVDQDNYRLGNYPDQRSALQAMIRRQGVKLLELAKDIEAVGLSPGEPLWVAPDPTNPGKYVVMEGNRRVTALKVMDNPALAAGSDFEAAYRKLATAFAARPRRTVRATVFESVEAARPWVERRHTNEQSGVGIQWWDPFAQDRAAKAAGRSRNRSMVALEHFSPGNPEPLAVELKIDDRTTTIDRVLNTFIDEFGDQLSISIPKRKPWLIDFGASPEVGAELLRAILVAHKGLGVDDVKQVGQRVNFLKEIIQSVLTAADRKPDPSKSPPDEKTDSSKGPSKGRGSPGHRGKSGDRTEPGRRPLKTSTERSTLAPVELKASQTLHIDGVRLKQIYQECRDIEVARFRNASGMLLRVFLELSAEAYCEAFIPLPRSHSGKADWSAKGIKLQEKVKAVLLELDPLQNSKPLAHAWEGLSEDPAVMHSLGKMHLYMHDPHRVIDATEVKQVWDRWHPLFREMHDRLCARE